MGSRFNRSIVVRLRYAYNLTDRFSRLRAAGLMTLKEMAVKLDVLPCTVKKWRDFHIFQEAGGRPAVGPTFSGPGNNRPHSCVC